MSNGFWLPSLLGDRKGEVDPFLALRRQMDSVFDSFLGEAQRDRLGPLMPRCDISETDTELRIVAELPGVDQKDIEVALVGNQLTIKGEKRSESESKDEKEGRHYHRVERTFGAFQRSVAVPFEVGPEAVDAAFKDGVLTVTLKKPPAEVARSRRIEVKGSA